MKNVAVLGTGGSVAEFSPEGYDWTIGVNDIWKIFQTKDIVCLDYPSAFKPDRLKVIQSSKPNKFFSQMVIWDIRPDFEQIKIKPGYPDRVCSLDMFQGFEKSYCSPFVAAQIAFRYYAAQEIHLYGVDLINHPHLDSKLCAKIKVHFQNLQAALKAKGSKIVVHGQGILQNL